MFDPKMRRLATALSFFLIAPLPAALAQTAPDIVVTGVRPDQAQSFVQQVALASPMADQLPRWDNEICTSIAGMPARQGQFLADRIAQRAAPLTQRNAAAVGMQRERREFLVEQATRGEFSMVRQCLGNQ